MTEDIVNAIALLVLALVVAILRPSSAQCPPGWSLGEGIRRTGEFACYSPPPRDCGDVRGPFERPCKPSPMWPSKVRRARIHCTGGSIPIVVDERTVGCHARH